MTRLLKQLFLPLAALWFCLAGTASGQILSVACSPATGPAQAGVTYSASCTASGGIAPYSWSISAGALPAGLTLTPSSDTTTATIAGSPTAAGSYSYTVEVTDSTPVVPMTAQQSYSGTIAPNITSISPTSTAAGQPGLTLTVNGAGFGSDSVVSFNSTALTTTVVSSNQVTAAVPASLLTLAGTASITLASGGATSNSAAFPVTPAISSLSPTSATAGGPAFTLTVNGTGFSAGASLSFNGTALSTTVANPSQLTASIPASLIATAGTFPVTVTSGGLASNSVNFTVGSAPALSSISPTSATAGGAAFTLTVNGSNFGGDSVVNFNGTALATTVVNASQVTATVPASLITTAGTFPVTLTTGGVTSNSATFTVVPALASISPTSATAGSSGFTLTVNGAGFTPGAAVQWNGSNLATSFVSSTQLKAPVLSNLIASPGTAQVTVQSGGVTSNAVTFTILAPPTISSINPATVTAGGAAFTLTVNGSGFAGDSMVQWNGAALSTNVLSSNEVTASVPASDISSPGSAQITVKSGGVTSNSETLTILAGPALSSLNPDTITAGSASFTLTASGTGFASGAVIQWNGAPLSTSFQSANELTATVPANLVAAVGTAQVSVSSSGVTSNSLTFTIVAAPTISSLSPNTITAGSAAFTLTVNGSGFASGAEVKWNGTAIGTVFVSSTQLNATVPAGNVATPGTAHVTVTSGGVTSNSVNFTVVSGPAITSLNPSTISAGAPAFTLTVNGTGFASGAVIEWNTTALSTTFKGATELTASIPANLIASAGTAQVTVKSNGVTSNALSFTVVAGPAVTSISPVSITAGTGAGLGPVGSCPARVYPAGTLTVNGTGFTSNSTVDWNGQPMLTTFVSATQLTACVSLANLGGYGAAAITVVSGTTKSNALQISLVVPSITITGLQPTSAPTQQLEVGIQLASATPTALQGTLQLSFSTTAPGVPSGYVDPGLQFSSGGTTATFSIGAGSNSARVAAIQQGTVEGTITVTLTNLTSNGTSVLPASGVTASVIIPPLPPVITAGSVQITNLTSSGFDVVLTGYSVTRDMNTANFSFTAAAGTAFSGTTTFAVPVGPVFTTWFDSTAGQENGSMFLLTVPFTISGPTSVLGSVSVTLTNSVGTSAAVSASP
ncbi:MAG TPA: IPT/TIG domain-containing protein [Bryobacteraceae bacterium]|nr:IPT/TIG domain-containing protein [Bryobacteraceae bacterium]